LFRLFLFRFLFSFGMNFANHDYEATPGAHVEKYIIFFVASLEHKVRHAVHVDQVKIVLKRYFYTRAHGVTPLSALLICK